MPNHHFHLINFTINKELSEIYTSMAIRSLALSMIGIFIPIYFLVELRYSISLIMIYYLIYSSFFALFTPIGAKLSSRIGFKHSMLISIPILILTLFLLTILKTNPSLFPLAAILEGTSAAIFWISFHIDFSKSSDRKHRAQEVSVWYTTSLIMALIGPLIGGLILTVSTFPILFIISSLLLLGSIIPLFLSKDQYVPSKFTLKNLISKAKIRDNLAFFSLGVREISANILWPIFIFFILKNYLNLGLLTSLTILITTFTIIGIGKFSDKLGKRKILKIGTLIDSITWLIRGAVSTITHVFTVTIIGQVGASGLLVPLTAITYDRATKDRIPYLVTKEISVCIGRIFILLVALVSGNLVTSFVISGITNYFFTLI